MVGLLLWLMLGGDTNMLETNNLINSRVWFVHNKDWEVKLGVLKYIMFSEQKDGKGYVLCGLATSEGDVSTEICHVFTKKPEAIEWQKKVKPIGLKMSKIAEEANKQVDTLRKTIIGEPS